MTEAQDADTETPYEQYVEDDTADKLDLSKPIPVEVTGQVHVQEFPANNITTGQVEFGEAGTPIKVVPARPGRVSVNVKNRAASEAQVWISGTQMGTTESMGYQLDPGEEKGFQMNGDVWAVCDTADAGAMHWVAENRDG